MSNAVFNSFHNAWHSLLSDVLNHGCITEVHRDIHSPASKYGKEERRSLELINKSFEVSDIRNRLIDNNCRRVNWAFLVANYFWTIFGRDDLLMINHYNSGAACFSSDKLTINSALGKRVFFPLRSQYSYVRELLKTDSTSRRAVIQILEPRDLRVDNIDVPCFNSIQFLIRAGSLYCTASMRSLSATMVLPYDFFLISMIHETLAVELKVALGSIFFNCTSLHIYEDEIDFTKELLRFKGEEPRPMIPMENFSSEIIDKLSKMELDFRVNNIISDTKLDSYWTGLFSSLVNHASPFGIVN
jgi:thymidylate synthase